MTIKTYVNGLLGFVKAANPKKAGSAALRPKLTAGQRGVCSLGLDGNVVALISLLLLF